MKRRTFVIASVLAPWASAQAGAVIERGREADVLALLAPHRLGAEVREGWKLWNVRIGSREIEIELRSPTDARAGLRLVEWSNHAERSASFGIVIENDAGSSAAIGAVVAAIKRNDRGGFWRARAEPAAEVPPSRGYGIAWPVGAALISIAAMLWVGRAKPSA